MRPFSPRFYRTVVTHLPRVPVRQDGEEEDTWPGPGTTLRANASQGRPGDRWTAQTEETSTDWELWFGYDAVVDAGVTINRGDQIVITPTYGPTVTLRASAGMVDWNQQHVDWYVKAQQIT